MTTQGPITVYNRRLGADRRDLYYPTRLSAASYAERMGSSHGGRTTTEAVSYRLRVPVDVTATEGRQFIRPEAYKALGDSQAAKYWTIQKLDLVTRGEPLVPGAATEREIRDAAAKAGLDVIIVEEYANNTDRGSPAVQHWRIGGR